MTASVGTRTTTPRSSRLPGNAATVAEELLWRQNSSLIAKPQVPLRQICELTRGLVDLWRSGRSGSDLDRARRARAVEQGGALLVARLQRAKALFVAISHDLIGADRMIETDRMADFVDQRVAQIVDL